MDKLKEKLSRLMYGRYGIDQLGNFMMWAAVAMMIFGAVVRSSLIYTLALVLIVWADVRIMSKNHSKRYNYPYGGGRGAVMQADPLYRCWAHVCEDAGSRGHTIYLSPCGRTFTQSVARELKDKYDHLILVCGHYEGIDQRFIDECVDEELSMGDFVVTGGEIPAMAVTDAICRMVPGVLPEEECFTEESHWAGLLEYPQYSRPDEWHGRRVPDVLLSGHHENVAKWRKKESYKRTMLRRPDMWAQFDEKQLKTKSEKKVLAEAKAEAEVIRAAEVKKAEESDTETTVE